MKSFDCTIANAEESIFSGKLTMLIATSVDGDLGIFPGHAPLLAQLNPGPLQLRKEDGEEDILYVSGGFLEVQPDQVSILADTALRNDQLSEQQIEQERQKSLASNRRQKTAAWNTPRQCNTSHKQQRSFALSKRFVDRPDNLTCTPFHSALYLLLHSTFF